MSDDEELGRIAYDAYTHSKYKRASETIPWEMQPPFWKEHWIAAARAVLKARSTVDKKEQDNG